MTPSLAPAPRIDERLPFHPVRIAVLTVSDTRGPEDDKSGDTLVERLTEAGHILAARALVRDDVELIHGQARNWIADPLIEPARASG